TFGNQFPYHPIDTAFTTDVDTGARKFRMLERDGSPQSPNGSLSKRDLVTIDNTLPAARHKKQPRRIAPTCLRQCLNEMKRADERSIICRFNRRFQSPEVHNSTARRNPRLEEIPVGGGSVFDPDALLTELLQRSLDLLTQSAAIQQENPRCWS